MVQNELVKVGTKKYQGKNKTDKDVLANYLGAMDT